MDWLVALLAQIFGIGLSQVVELANREDTIDDSIEPALDSLIDADLDAFDGFELLNADPDPLREIHETAGLA